MSSNLIPIKLLDINEKLKYFDDEKNSKNSAIRVEKIVSNEKNSIIYFGIYKKKKSL